MKPKPLSWMRTRNSWKDKESLKWIESQTQRKIYIEIGPKTVNHSFEIVQNLWVFWFGRLPKAGNSGHLSIVSLPPEAAALRSLAAKRDTKLGGPSTYCNPLSLPPSTFAWVLAPMRYGWRADSVENLPSKVNWQNWGSGTCWNPLFTPQDLHHENFDPNTLVSTKLLWRLITQNWIWERDHIK